MSATFRQRIPALILISMTQFMIPFDYMSITLATLRIRDGLGMSPEVTPWILSSYILTFGGFLLLGGKFADLYGRRRILIIGLLVFCFFSVLTAFTTNTTMFLAARALKGLGAALMSPAMLSLLNNLFPEGPQRHRALGTYWFCAVAGGATGMWLGGLLAGYSWRLALFVNVPIGLLLAFLATRVLEESKGQPSGAGFDYAGAVLSTFGFGALIFTVTNALWQGFNALTLTACAVAVISLYGFYRVELAHPSPLVPPAFFRLRNIVGANLFCFFWAAANTNYPVSLFLQQVYQFTPGQAGLAMLPGSIAGLLSVFLVVKVLDRYGPKRTMIAGALVEGLGILVFCTLTPATGYVYMFPGVILTSIGFALAGISVKLPATYGIPAHDQGVASGIIFATQQLGNAFAVPVYSAVLGLALTSQVDASAWSLASGFRWTFAVAIVFLIICVVATLALVRDNPHGEKDPDDTPTANAHAPEKVTA